MILNTVTSIEDLRAIIKSWRLADESIALVPTMGNLHAGHLQLVEVAQQHKQRVIVSIFVNPTQFGLNEDFDAYPRTEAEDKLKLEQKGVDLLFLPDIKIMYPKAMATVIKIKGLSKLHCGHSRPGHFSGVATIACKLFNIVQPDSAFFGQKDFQQFAVIDAMVQDLNIPVQITAVPTVRETDGLAMSSRNAYLSQQQRQIAPQLFQCLQVVCAAIMAGCVDFNQITGQQLEQLKKLGFEPDYLSICRQSDLLPATIEDYNLVVLVAAKLGDTRLIDNISFSRHQANFRQ